MCKGKGKIPLTRCPLYYLRQNPSLTLIMQLHAQCENGVYPEKGGLWDQSAKFMAIKAIIDTEIAILRKD